MKEYHEQDKEIANILNDMIVLVDSREKRMTI